MSPRCLRRASLAAGLVLALGARAAADTWTSTAVPVATVDQGVVALPVGVDSPFIVSDLNVIVTLAHSDVSQLRVSVRHPDGTVALLVASLPGSEVMHACFDDEAAALPAGGAAPYTGSWQPAEPLAVFDGKPAAGTWTLEVEDSVGGLAGTVLSGTLAFNGRTFVSADVPKPLPDFLTALSSVFVPPALLVEDVDLTVWLDHTCPSDLRTELHTPDGTSASVTTGVFQCSVPGGMQGTTWDDGSAFLIIDAPAPHRGRFKSQSLWGPPLLSLVGPHSGGNWLLRIPDAEWGDEGVLRAWSIHVTGADLCPGLPSSVTSYGVPVAGTFGPPVLHASQPWVGSVLTVALFTGSPVASSAALFVGAQSAAVPGKGGTLLVDPLFSLPMFMPALPQIQLVFEGFVPSDLGLCGVPLYLQVLQLDPGAPQGVAFSQGLELVLGG